MSTGGRKCREPLRKARVVSKQPGAKALERRLFDEFRIEVPVKDWNGQPLIRVSIAPYNTLADLHQLVAALGTVSSK